MMVGMKIVHCIVNDYVGTFDMDEDNSLFVLTIIRNVQSKGIRIQCALIRRQGFLTIN